MLRSTVFHSSRRSLLSALFVVMLAAAALVAYRPAQAQSPIASATQSVGRVVVIHGDDDTTGAPIESQVILITDDGTTVRLLPDAAAGLSAADLLAQDGHRVAVGGASVSGPTTNQAAGASGLLVRSLQPLESTAAAAAASGPWLSIACRAADSTASLRDLSFYEGMYRSSFPSLSDYWRVASGGALDLSGSTAVGWYDLPGTRQTYSGNLFALVADCTAAADADVDFSVYAGVNLFFSDSLGGSSYGFRYPLGLDGAAHDHGVTLIAQASHARQATILHEMGHGYGMTHSNTATGIEYLNPWDIMGKSGATCSLVDATYGCVGQLPAATYRHSAGLTPNAAPYTAVSGQQTITLGAGGYALATIPVSGDPNRYYAVEARARSGYDQQLPAAAVVIYDVVTNRSDYMPARLVGDYTLDSSATDSAWLPGEVFVAAVSDISVEVVKAVSGGYEVVIRKDTPYVPPAPPAPTPTPTPPPPPPPAAPVNIVATDDTYVASNALNKAYGSLAVVRVKDTARADFVAYLKFQVTGLSKAPAAAKLRLYVADPGTDGGTVYRVGNESRSGVAWTEKALTWANAPTLGSSLVRIGAVPKKGWIEVNLGGAITGNGTYSFAIRNASSNLVAYGSSESANRPQLVITP